MPHRPLLVPVHRLQTEHPPCLRWRKWLFTGLLVIVPGVITIAVLNWIVGTLDQTLQILPLAWHPDKLRGLAISGFGVLLTLLILLVVGATASNFAGRKLVQWGDRLVSRIPVVRSIYSSVKQVSDTLFSESGNAFRTAVLEAMALVKGSGPSPSSRARPTVRWQRICAMNLSAWVPTTPIPRWVFCDGGATASSST